MGGENVAHDVAHNVPHNVPHDKISLEEFIINKMGQSLFLWDEIKSN